jgi:hypothetical protein
MGSNVLPLECFWEPVFLGRLLFFDPNSPLAASPIFCVCNCCIFAHPLSVLVPFVFEEGNLTFLTVLQHTRRSEVKGEALAEFIEDP